MAQGKEADDRPAPLGGHPTGEDPPTPRARHLTGWLIIAGIAAFCLAVIWMTTTFDRVPPILRRGMQPADFPQLIAGLILLLTGLLAWRDRPAAEEPMRRAVWVTIALLAGFALLTMGDLFLALGAFAAALSASWGERRIVMLALVGLVVPAGIFFLFDQVFEIRFPHGLLTSLWYG